jgi:hypothetical protein
MLDKIWYFCHSISDQEMFYDIEIRVKTEYVTYYMGKQNYRYL